jgi:hypothetical protein
MRIGEQIALHVRWFCPWRQQDAVRRGIYKRYEQ